MPGTGYGHFLAKLSVAFLPRALRRPAYRRVTVMFSAVKEGVFQPTLGVEYTDDEVGFEAEEHWGGRTAREEVRKTRRERRRRSRERRNGSRIALCRGKEADKLKN